MKLYLLLSTVFMVNVSYGQYLNEWAVHIEGGERLARSISKRHGFIFQGQIGTLEDYYLLEHPHVTKRSADKHTHYHVRLKRESKVLWTEQQFVKKRVKRDLIERDVSSTYMIDPLWSQQWYLHKGAMYSMDMSVIPAWNKGYSGKGISVTILDDGIEKDHPDLQENYDALASYDYNGKDSDPQPRYDITNENKHGTRCAGEVAAVANNSVCSVGVAFHASIGGVRMLDGDVTDVVEANSLSLNPNHIDIYSASWGPDDNGQVVDGPAVLAKKAFIDGITKGRNGKGNIFVWASGNGGRSGDSCNCDGYTNSIYTLSVSSVSDKGLKPWYLEECSSTIATTYSSGETYADKQIVTTDLNKKCTTRHTGTSASAPLAAGICALALEANPSLSWRDMQHIVVRTSVPAAMTDGNFKVNGVNRKVSNRYGYGLMNASAMVNLAETWVTAPEQHICTVTMTTKNREIKGKRLQISMSTSGCKDDKQKYVRYLEHVQAKLTIRYSRRGDLIINLISPSGTSSNLLPKRPRDSRTQKFNNWPFMSTHFWEENPTGEWSLEILNGGNALNSGTLESFELVLYGTSENPERHRKYITPGTKPTAQVTPGTISGSTTTGEHVGRHRGDAHEKTQSSVPTTTKKAGGWNWLFGGKNTPTPTIPSTTTATQTTATQTTDSITTDEATTTTILFTTTTSTTTTTPTTTPTTTTPTTTTPSTTTITCDGECKNGCRGPTSQDCVDCLHVKAVNGSCIADCEDNEFTDPQRTCQTCHLSCVNCHGPSDTECISCASDKVFNREEGSCLEDCPSGFYTEEDDNICKECDDVCLTCKEMSTKCNSCQDNKLLINDTCQNKCQDDQYRNTATGRCALCDMDCETCSGASSDDCLSCSSTTYYQNGSCVDKCSIGYYRQGLICKGCHSSCLSCTGENIDQCRDCHPGFKFVNGQCMKSVTCPLGQYERRGQCMSCYPSCGSCSGQREDECLTCQLGRYLDEGECVDTCVAGYYPYEGTGRDGIHIGECRTCHSTCRTCDGGSSTDCVSCLRGKHIKEGRCIFSCEDRQYHDHRGRCQPCYKTCNQCSGPDETDCTRCETSEYLIHGKCVKDCPEGHYHKDGECRRCHRSCETCTGETRKECITCRSTHYKGHHDGLCHHKPKCSSVEYFSDTNQECLVCDSTCLTCNGTGPTSCLTCDLPRKLNQNTCILCCNVKQLPDCCKCDQNGLCTKSTTKPNIQSGNRAINAGINKNTLGSSSKIQIGSQWAGVVVLVTIICLSSIVIFFVIFGLLQAKANHTLCWQHSYERLPVHFDNINTNTLLLTRDDFVNEDDLMTD